VIKWIAPSPDVEAQIALADCVVLPSFYGEGLSRVLMEGAAMARPLIASDIAGCREAVEDGVNGYLVEPRDTASLTAACSRFIALTPTKRKRMATASRRLAERLFDIDDVYKIYTDIMRFSYASSVRP
jgi:glycosyltransferase involved in cell wall biosynthesis